jgi:hypothetical protein
MFSFLVLTSEEQEKQAAKIKKKNNRVIEVLQEDAD